MELPMKPTQRLKYSLAALLLLSLTVAPRKAHGESNAPVVEITAKRFGFTPNQITLKKGEAVKLRLTSEDVTHGFFMKKLKIDEVMEPGKPTEITLTPETAGNFTTICDH